jgi:carboxymethylenebutenolidase
MTLITRPEGQAPEDFHLTRRGVASLFFAGYALAAVSAEAEPIHTPADGLTIEEVMLPSPDRQIPGYLARPAAPGRYAAVIVVSEVFGIHEYIKDVCRRLAHLGYVALAPAFFVRAGDPAGISDMGQVMRIVAAASDQQVMGDVGGAIRFLSRQRYVDMRRLAITGFCWGGGITWLACEQFPQIRAGAAWYGRLAPAANAPPNPDRLWPIQRVEHLSAPVLGLYAGRDPLSQAIPAMRAALAAAHKTGTDFIVYPDANHGFHADYRPTYNAQAAQDGWAHMLSHFARNGVPPGRA